MSDVADKLALDLRRLAEAASNDASKYLTTEQAANELGTTVRALLRHVQRGSLKPDLWGGRGAFKSHRFTRETLLAFATRKSA